jgi:hypothetical protein
MQMVGEQQGVPPRLGPIGMALAGGPGSRRGLTVHHQSHQPNGCGRVHQPSHGDSALPWMAAAARRSRMGAASTARRR